MSIIFKQNDIHFILKCEVIICQVHFLYHRNAQYTMARRTHVLKTHTLNNRARQQMNQAKQLFNVSTIHSNHSLQSVQPSVCHATDQ